MELTLTSFESFLSESDNSELISNSKYGIHELVDGSFVSKEINESDFSLYQHVSVDFESESIMELNSQKSCWPFVELK